MEEDKSLKQSGQPNGEPCRAEQVVSAAKKPSVDRAMSDTPEQRMKKRREEQQAIWRDELNQENFRDLTGVLAGIIRDVERLRAKDCLTERNQEQGMRLIHWVAEFQKNLCLWENIQSNLDRLLAALRQNSVEEAIKALEEVRPGGVANVKSALEKRNLIAADLKRCGTQILDEKLRLDEEVQTNLREDRTIQDEIQQMVRRIERKTAHEVLEDFCVVVRLPLEKRLPRLKAIHGNLKRSLEGGP